eukprot:TRINITY_DN50369_c0_g1_i1.p1 TRINITY_DN50369_c0_g1~~TRINITY_DN50369_c0_g1_i1.p1  ORF type:complete len:207 (+),score=34.71 TRINITY_DN50369_c0_g1_i1:163-783(+)
MLRSLVGSEMCIRDRVSTQSTGRNRLTMAMLGAPSRIPSRPQTMNSQRAAAVLERAKTRGLDQALVAGDPGAAGLLPRVAQRLLSGTMNLLRTEPEIAAACVHQGLIRSIPDPTRFGRVRPSTTTPHPTAPRRFGFAAEAARSERRAIQGQGVRSCLMPVRVATSKSKRVVPFSGWNQAKPGQSKIGSVFREGRSRNRGDLQRWQL